MNSIMLFTPWLCRLLRLWAGRQCLIIRTAFIILHHFAANMRYIINTTKYISKARHRHSSCPRSTPSPPFHRTSAEKGFLRSVGFETVLHMMLRLPEPRQSNISAEETRYCSPGPVYVKSRVRSEATYMAAQDINQKILWRTKKCQTKGKKLV